MDAGDLFSEANKQKIESTWKALEKQGVSADIISFLRSREEKLWIKSMGLEYAAEGVVISDCRAPDMPIIYCNPAFLKITGYAYEDIIGRNCRFLQGTGTDIKTLNQLRQAIRENQPINLTLLNYRKDGTEFWNYLSIAPLCISGDSVTHYIGIQSDVTHRVQLEQKLQRMNSTLERRVQERTQELQRTEEATILTISGLVETRDPETGEHIERTRLYVRALAEHLADMPAYSKRLPPEEIDLLFRSAPLHDIGKVGIPDHILLKPGQLTDEEFTVMKKHAQIGGDSLRWAEESLGKNSFLRLAREIAYTHHEKWDGSGYPNGLQGDEIPLSGRLMALADVYDALRSKRVYKDAMPHEKASQIILAGRDSHFDPAVVDAFFALEDTFIRISKEHEDSEAGELSAE